MKKNTQIFAHRGATHNASDNTRAAFNDALEYSIDGMETDVQLSRDDIPVLWHDRYTDKLGYPSQHIGDFDYAQLEKMDFSLGKNQPEGVLSLKEFLHSYQGRCRLQIEIKNRDWEQESRHHSKIKQSIDLIGNPDKNNTFISSFNLNSLIFADAYAPGFPLYFALDNHSSFNEIKRVLSRYPFLQGFCLHIDLLNNDIATLLQNHQKRIATYTCNTDAQIHKALNLSVDELITDDPVKALALRT